MCGKLAVEGGVVLSMQLPPQGKTKRVSKAQRNINARTNTAVVDGNAGAGEGAWTVVEYCYKNGQRSLALVAPGVELARERSYARHLGYAVRDAALEELMESMERYAGSSLSAVGHVGVSWGSVSPTPLPVTIKLMNQSPSSGPRKHGGVAAAAQAPGQCHGHR